jgi:polyphosphate kinase
MDTYLTDQRSAWDMMADGSYVQRLPSAPAANEASHSRLIDRSEKRRAESLKPKKNKSKGK